MVDIIMNERAWCEDILENFHTGSTYDAIARLARYFHSKGLSRADVERNLENYLVRYDPETNLVKWQSSIDKCLDNMDKRPLINVDFVPVTQKEMDTIDGLQRVTDRKVMFTLLCLVKYLDAVEPKNSSWCRYEIRDIFARANCIMNIQRRGETLRKLRDAGMITFSRIVDNTNLHVNIVDHDGEAVLKIDDFRNLGYQYMSTKQDGYMRCQMCGLTVLRKSPAQKYCTACASDAVVLWRNNRGIWGSAAWEDICNNV